MKQRNGLTKSIDGQMRVAVRVPIRLDLREIATFITAELTDDLCTRTQDGLRPCTETIRKAVPSRQAAIRIAQDCVLNYGIETPHYRVGDDGLGHVMERVLDHLRDLWGE